MSLKERTINVDIMTKEYTKLKYKQGESGQNINIKLFKNGKQLDLIGLTVNAFFEKTNGEILEKSATINDNVATITLSKQILNIAGKIKTELYITKGEELVISFTIIIDVEESINASSVVEEKEEWDSIKDLLIKSNNLAMIDDNNVSNKTTSSSYRINSQLEDIKNDFNSQIKEKANNIDLAVERARIDSFTKLAEGSTTGDAELIDARIGEDGVTYSNLGTGIRTQFKTLYNHLENAEIIKEITINNLQNVGYINTNGKPDDSITTWRYSDYIPCDGFKKINVKKANVVNSGSVLTLYNEEYSAVYISPTYSNFEEFIIDIPEYAKYVRFCNHYNTEFSAIMVGISNNHIIKEVDELHNIINYKEELEKYTPKVIEKINLFNKETVTSGHYVEASSGNIIANNSFWLSDYIPVKPNTTYTIRYINQIREYKTKDDIGYKGVGGYSDTTTAESSTFTTGSETKYVRFCGSNNQLNSAQLEEGDSFTKYYSFKENLNINVNDIQFKKQNNLLNLLNYSENPIKIILGGDSITHGVGGTGFAQDGEKIIGEYRRNTNGYCWAKLFKEYIENNYNATVTNNAIIGTASTFWKNNISTLVPADSDVLLLTIGTNDRHIKKANPLTRVELLNRLYNNLHSIAAYCESNNIQLILASPIPATAENEALDDGVDKRILHSFELSNVIERVATECDCKFINLYNAVYYYYYYKDLNFEEYLPDGLHPGDSMYKVMFYEYLRLLGLTPHYRPVD